MPKATTKIPRQSRKHLSADAVEEIFRASEADPTWAFSELSTRDTRYVTHGYHTYPAKFIPQVAARLIERHTQPGALVADPFMGSGTTLVEAKLLGRRSVGVDINPVAHLISTAKTTPVPPNELEHALACATDALASKPAKPICGPSAGASLAPHTTRASLPTWAATSLKTSARGSPRRSRRRQSKWRPTSPT